MEIDYIVTYGYTDQDGKNVQDEMTVRGFSTDDAMAQVRYTLHSRGIEPLYLTAEETS